MCKTCRAVRQLPEGYFPRVLNEVICAEDICLHGEGACRQRFLPLKVAKIFHNSRRQRMWIRLRLLRLWWLGSSPTFPYSIPCDLPGAPFWSPTQTLYKQAPIWWLRFHYASVKQRKNGSLRIQRENSLRKKIGTLPRHLAPRSTQRSRSLQLSEERFNQIQFRWTQYPLCGTLGTTGTTL